MRDEDQTKTESNEDEVGVTDELLVRSDNEAETLQAYASFVSGGTTTNTV